MRERGDGSHQPFGTGAISVRIYTHDLPADGMVDDLRAQAQLAERVGFDGVTMGEHHAGSPGYVPSPVTVAAALLAATESVWVAPCPVLLPLRTAATVAEDLAWLAAAYPGRLGCGFAPGSLGLDFDLVDVPLDERAARFAAAIPPVVEALAGRPSGGLADDPAVQWCIEHPVPTLLACTSRAGVARAAATGAGLHLDLVSTDERLRALVDHYRALGGNGPRVLIKQVWLGPPPGDRHLAQRDFYEAYSNESTKRNWLPGDHTIASESAEELAARLLEHAAACSATALDLRVTVAGMTGEETRAQMQLVADDVLPILRGSEVLAVPA